jgi:hypothetical protein
VAVVEGEPDEGRRLSVGEGEDDFVDDLEREDDLDFDADRDTTDDEVAADVVRDIDAVPVHDRDREVQVEGELEVVDDTVLLPDINDDDETVEVPEAVDVPVTEMVVDVEAVTESVVDGVTVREGDIDAVAVLVCDDDDESDVDAAEDRDCEAEGE